MKNWWAPGLQIGYEHTFIHQCADFLLALDENRAAAPTFRDGLATDYVTDANISSLHTLHTSYAHRLPLAHPTSRRIHDLTYYF
jgi:nitrate reductase beta subunit